MIDVIALAKQVGGSTYTNRNDLGMTTFGFTQEGLERFAQLVAEDCAQLCHERMMELRFGSCGVDDYDDMKADGAEICALAIRASLAAKEPS